MLPATKVKACGEIRKETKRRSLQASAHGADEVHGVADVAGVAEGDLATGHDGAAVEEQAEAGSDLVEHGGLDGAHGLEPDAAVEVHVPHPGAALVAHRDVVQLAAVRLRLTSRLVHPDAAPRRSGGRRRQEQRHHRGEHHQNHGGRGRRRHGHVVELLLQGWTERRTTVRCGLWTCVPMYKYKYNVGGGRAGRYRMAPPMESTPLL